MTIQTELAELAELATALSRLPPPSRRNPEAWHIGRDAIAREIARSVGRLRQELGIRADDGPALRAEQRDCGATHVTAGGRAIPVERPRKPARSLPITAASRK